MRSTIHLVSRADYWPLTLGVRQPRREWFLPGPGRRRRGSRWKRRRRRSDRRLRTVRCRQADLYRLVGTEFRNGIGLWLDMVRVPPAGTWERRRADLYGLAEQWVGPPRGTPDQGLELLVRRRLGGFGPASRTEIADWAGLPVTVLAPVLDRMNLRRFRAEDGTVLLDLPRAPLPDPGTPVPVRFLPTWDASLLVHARRSGILPEQYRPRIFHVRAPHSFNTFLVDGAVAGTWRFEGGKVRCEEFAPLRGGGPPGTRRRGRPVGRVPRLSAARRLRVTPRSCVFVTAVTGANHRERGRDRTHPRGRSQPPHRDLTPRPGL